MFNAQDIEANVSRSQGYKVREMSIPELQTGSRGGKQTDVERGASKTRRSLKIHIPQHLGDGRSPSSRGVSVMNSSAQDSAGVVLCFCVSGMVLTESGPSFTPTYFSPFLRELKARHI